MRRGTLQAIVGLILLAGQFLTLLLIIIGYFQGGFAFPEMTTAIAITAPVFAAYTTVVVRSFLAENQKKSGRSRVRAAFAVVSLAFPLMFGFFTVGVVIAWNRTIAFDEFEEFKIMLGLSELLFGAYLGYVIKALFGAPLVPERPLAARPLEDNQ